MYVYVLCKTTIGKGNKDELRIRLVLTAKGEILSSLSGDYRALMDSWYSGEHRDTGKIFFSPSNNLSLSRRKNILKIIIAINWRPVEKIKKNNNYSKSTEHPRDTENTNRAPWENPLLLSAFPAARRARGQAQTTGRTSLWRGGGGRDSTYRNQ